MIFVRGGVIGFRCNSETVSLNLAYGGGGAFAYRASIVGGGGVLDERGQQGRSRPSLQLLELLDADGRTVLNLMRIHKWLTLPLAAELIERVDRIPQSVIRNESPHEGRRVP